MTYTSPLEYLTDLWPALQRPVPYLSTHDHEDAKWMEIQNRGVELSSLAHFYTRDDFHNYQPLVDMLWRDLCIGLHDSAKIAVEEHLILSVLDHGEANAAIYRSPEGFCAVLLNLGLIQLLLHYLKLRVAYFEPDTVRYCTRGDAHFLSSRDYFAFIKEHLTNYKRDGYPHGAKVHLSETRNAYLGEEIHAIELFILGHEVGHYINGDLDDDASFVPCVEHLPSVMFSGNTSHSQEHAADTYGFQLISSFKKATGKEVDPDRIFMPIYVFFSFLFMLGMRECSTHPSPLDRSKYIAKLFCTDSMIKTVYDDIRRDENLDANEI